MIARLILRHEILHSLTKPLLITFTTVTLMLNILAFQMAKDQSLGLVTGPRAMTAHFVFLIPLAVILWMGKADRRCRPWEMALPVASPVLWLSYLGALVLAVLLMIGVSTLGFIGFGSLLDAFAKNAVFNWVDLVAVVARPAAASLTAVLLLGLWRPSVVRLSGAPGWQRHKLLVLAGTVVLLFILIRIPPVYGLVPVALAALWAWRVAGTLPPALDLGGTANGTGQAGGQDVSWTVPGPSRRVVRLMVLRTLFKWPLSWIAMAPIALVIGMMMSGARVFGFDDTHLRYMNFFMTVYILFAMSNHFMENLHKIDHLPVDRRVLLRWLLVPVTLFFLGGYGVGKLTAVMGDPRLEEIVFENSSDGYGLKVPPGAWEFAAGGEPPVITDPAGESHPAQSVTVFRGLPGILWKPATTPETASEGFVAWQIARAVKEVHGLDIPPAEIAARYLEQDPGGRVVVRAEGLTIMADYPEARPMGSGPVFPFWVGGELVCLMLVCLLYFRTFRPGVTIRKARVVFWSLLAGLMALHIGGYAMFIRGVTREWVFTGFWTRVTRNIEAMGPVGIASLWVVAALLLVLTWRAAEKAFLKAEAPSS